MNTKRKKKGSAKKSWKWFIGAAVLFFILSGVAYGGMVVAGEGLMDEKQLKMVETSVIVDKDGDQAGKLFVENREYVPYNEIPEKLAKTFIAVEDERFLDHGGIDFIGIGRALYYDIMAGDMVQGASTITQQLARNAFLSHEKTVLRKTKEALIAINMERKYSKEQILEMYLNQIYFGHGAYGIQAASQLYFGKDIADLQVQQMAMLAALPKAPNNYSPFNNLEKALERKNLVLKLMEKHKLITPEERKQAEEADLELLAGPAGKKEHMRTYIDYVIHEAEEKFGIPEDDLYRGGYTIHTALDQIAQRRTYEAFQNDALFPKGGAKRKVESGMVVLDARKGGITAMVGGREYVAKGLNRALIQRQPGSTFKPIAVYAPALESGWHPYDLLKDEQMSFGEYKPNNYDGKYRGKVQMYEAVRMSYNVPAVWLLNEIGVDKGVSMAEKFGIHLTKQDRNLSIALGGLTEGTSPLKMAQAYSAFSNDGVMFEAHAITKIVAKDGTVIASADPKAKEVISSQTAYYMTKMLEAVVQDGTGKNARMAWPVAGKTGTTQHPGVKGANKDAWFVGYTPYYVGAVWLGFDATDDQHYLQGGSGYAAGIFRDVMSKIHKGKPVTAFARPDGVEELQPPVKMTPISDLTARMVLDTRLKVHLTWTPNEDERIKYRIYRFEESPENRELMDEVVENSWVGPFDFKHYYKYAVVPYNPETDQEGELSNIAEADLTLLPELLRFDEEFEGEGNGEAGDRGSHNKKDKPNKKDIEKMLEDTNGDYDSVLQWLEEWFAEQDASRPDTEPAGDGNANDGENLDESGDGNAGGSTGGVETPGGTDSTGGTN